MPFCNQNGIMVKKEYFCGKNEAYRLGYKKVSIFQKILKMENMDLKLSKSCLRMFLALLDQNLCVQVYPNALGKNPQNHDFCDIFAILIKMRRSI